MAITKSAKKRIKSSEKKRVFNTRRSREMKEQIKSFTNAIGKGSKDEAEKMLPKVFKAIDKAAKRGVIKENNAARKKSRLSKKLS
tara:strand:- start:391 stop:645 length:255 start_codon:yes stop_codon:yes gene_type:complete